MAHLAALQKEHEQLRDHNARQLHQNNVQQISNNNTPVVTNASSPSVIRSLSQQHQIRSRMNEAGAELEEELRNALSQTDINATTTPSAAMIIPPNYKLPQPPIPSIQPSIQPSATQQQQSQQSLQAEQQSSLQPLSRRTSLMRSVSKSRLSKFMLGGGLSSSSSSFEDHLPNSVAPPAEEAPPMPAFGEYREDV
ncbi:UNVERIFIED_CONTAM: hypothetical protein HDU68_007060, partial [Siphonaria sp. JEL0065]